MRPRNSHENTDAMRALAYLQALLPGQSSLPPREPLHSGRDKNNSGSKLAMRHSDKAQTAYVKTQQLAGKLAAMWNSIRGLLAFAHLH